MYGCAKSWRRPGTRSFLLWRMYALPHRFVSGIWKRLDRTSLFSAFPYQCLCRWAQPSWQRSRPSARPAVADLAGLEGTSAVNALSCHVGYAPVPAARSVRKVVKGTAGHAWTNLENTSGVGVFFQRFFVRTDPCGRDEQRAVVRPAETAAGDVERGHIDLG